MWSDTASDNVVGLILFALAAPGAVGVALQPTRSLLGTVLTAAGGLAMALLLFWAILPLVLGPAIAVLAVVRARRLGRTDAGTAAGPRSAVAG